MDENTKQATTPPTPTSSFAGIPLHDDRPAPDEIEPLQKISLVDDAPKGPALSLVEGGHYSNGVQSQEAIDRKTNKYAFALGKDFDKETIRDAIRNGTDGSLRTIVASKLDAEDDNVRKETLNDILSKGLPTDPSAQSVMYSNVQSLVRFKPKNDPATVVEKLYAKEYLKAAAAIGSKGGILLRTIEDIGNRVVDEQPHDRIARARDEMSLSLMEQTERQLMSQEIAHDVHDKLQAMVKAQGWGDFLLDIGKGFVNFYSTAKTHDLLEKTGFLTKEGNLDEQFKLFVQRPPEEQKKFLEEKVLNGLAKDNPLLALEFVSKLIGYTASDKFFDNVENVLDVVSLPGMQALGRKGINAFRGPKPLEGEILGPLPKDPMPPGSGLPPRQPVTIDGEVIRNDPQLPSKLLLPAGKRNVPLSPAEEKLDQYLMGQGVDISRLPRVEPDDILKPEEIPFDDPMRDHLIRHYERKQLAKDEADETRRLLELERQAAEAGPLHFSEKFAGVTTQELQEASKELRRDLIRANSVLVRRTKQKKKGETDPSVPVDEEMADVRQWIKEGKQDLRDLDAELTKRAEAQAVPEIAETQHVANTLKDVIRSNADPDATPGDRLAIMGDIEGAAVDNAVRSPVVQSALHSQTGAGPFRASGNATGSFSGSAPSPGAGSSTGPSAASAAPSGGPQPNAAGAQTSSWQTNWGGTAAQQQATANRTLPGIFNPSSSRVSLAAGFSNNLSGYMTAHADRFNFFLDNYLKVARLPEQALQEAFRMTVQEFKDTIVHANQAFQNGSFTFLKGTTFLRPEWNADNVGRVVFTIAKPNGQGFRRALDGYRWSQRWLGLNKRDLSAIRIGNEWFITTTWPIDETRPSVRNLLIPTENKSPLQKWMGAPVLKGGSERVSEFQEGNRLAALHGQQGLQQVIFDLTKDIQLYGDSRAAVIRVMEEDRTRLPPPRFPNQVPKPGYYHQDEQEFEATFVRLNGRQPTQKETQSYFLSILAMRMDYVLRNMNMYKEYTRQGIKEVRLRTKLKHPTSGLTYFDDTAPFHGKVIEELPIYAKEPATVAIYHEGEDPIISDLSDWKNADYLQSTGHPAFAGMTSYKDLLNNGYRIIHTGNPSRRPGKEVFGDENVSYIITKDFEINNLPETMIPDREGWHLAYPYPVYVKMPVIREFSRGQNILHSYEGDITWLGANSPKEAQQYADSMNKAIQIAYHGAPGNLRDVLDAELPYSEARFRQLFEGVDPYFDKDQKFYVVSDGVITMDKHREEFYQRYPNLRDQIRTEHNVVNQVDKQFAGARDEDIHYIKQGVGTQGQPVFQLHKPEKLDPYSTLSQGLTHVMRNTFMLDYRIQAIESWLAEFKDVIPATEQELRISPLNYLYRPEWVNDPTKADRIRTADASRRAILEFLGTPTPLSIEMDGYRYKMLDLIYDKAGQEALENARPHVMARLTDPLKFARAVVYHKTMGFFNVFHALQNTTQIATAAMISPEFGVKAAIGAIIHHYTLFNNHPNIVNHLANLAANHFGIDRALWLEARREWQLTNRAIVEGDVAIADSYNNPSVYKDAFKEHLDKGLALFKWSEVLTRRSAYFMAFLEWRKANPTKAITAQDRNRILARSDLLSNRMTRASAAPWQSGILAPWAQYMGFQARLMEVMWSGKGGYNSLSLAAKFRVVVGNSMLWGVPVGLFGPLVGLFYPSAYDDIRKAEIKYLKPLGVNVDNQFLLYLHNGIIGQTIANIIGSKGSDFGRVFGPAGGGMLAQTVEAVLKGENLYPLDMLLGNSSKSTSTFLAATSPFLGYVNNIINGKEQLDAKMMAHDLKKMIEQIGTGKQAVKALLYVSNRAVFAANGEKLGEVDGAAGAMYTIFGSLPQEIVDAKAERAITKDREKVLKEDILPLYRDALIHLADAAYKYGKDHEETRMWSRRLKLIMNTMTSQEHRAMIRQIDVQDPSLVTKMTRKYPLWEQQHEAIKEKQ